MRLYLILFALALGIASAKCEIKTEENGAIIRSSVTKSGKDAEKQKIDSETKEQLEESENDDKVLEQQEKDAKAKEESDNDATENSTQESDEGSGEEATVENADDTEKEDDKTIEEDDSTIKRAEESKGSKGKSGKKILAYPIFYPGDYFGHHHETGGPYGFHPGSIWEYPYPYVHPMYPSPFYPCACNCKGTLQ